MEETVTCKITLYQMNSLFRKEKNFVCESLLNNLDVDSNYYLELSDQKIVRQGLSIVCRLDSPLPQSETGMDALSQASWIKQDFNYAKIETKNGIGSTLKGQDRRMTYLCFIDKIEQGAKGTVVVDMTVDTLNTFFSKVVFTDKCHIVREHRDRYAYSASSRVYKEKIDRYPEGLECNLLRTSSTLVAPDVGGMQNWYLSYSTKNDLTSSNITNPVSVKVIPEDSLSINQSSSNVVTSSSLEDGKHYLVFSNENSGGYFEQYPTYILGNDMPNSTDEFVSVFDFYKNDNYVRLTGYRVNKSDGSKSTFLTATSDTSLTLSGISKVRIISSSYDTGAVNEYEYAVQVTEGYFSVGSSPTLTKFSDYDRSDSKLMKIIELPYAPFQESLTSGSLDIPTGFSVVGGYLYADSFDTEFKQRISLEYKPFDFTTIHSSIPKLADVNFAPSSSYDPKIHHSDFYSIKFVYDSYSVQYRMEDMIPNSDTLAYEPYLDIYFQATNTINSKFLFTLKPSNRGYTYYSDQDYPLIILAARNNEKTIFTNDYLNYIRTGYNYDLKKNSASITASILSSAVSIGGGLLASATGGPLGAAIGIGAAASGIGSAISVINSAYQNDTSMKSKLQTLAFQSTGVSGSDDLDLFKGYNSKNKLRVMIYEPRDDVKSMLESLWYYYGYKTNRFGKPDFYSRYWFNYCQGDVNFYFKTNKVGSREADITYHNENGMTDEMYLDFKNRFTEGVTVLHYRSLTLGSETRIFYDFAQNLENMEMSVYNQLTA